MTSYSRRLIAAGAVLAVGVGTAGCGAVDTPGSNSGGGSDGSGATLQISALSDHPYIKDEVERYQEENPDVDVQFVEAPSNTYQATIRSQLSAGNGPDVMFVWAGSGNSMATKTLAEEGLLADLSDAPWVADQPAQSLDLVTHEDKVYSLNVFQNPTGVVYDTDMMSDLGLEPPTTYSGLLDFCQEVSDQGIVPIAMGNQTGYLNTEVPLELANSLAYSADPEFGTKAAAGEIDWATDEVWNDALRESLEKYIEMNDAGCFQENSTGYSDQQAISLVASDKALGVNIIASAFSSVMSANGDKNYNVFELPATENPDDTWLTTNPGSCFAVNADSPNLDAALDFIDFLGAPEQVARDSEAYFGVPYVVDPEADIQEEFAGVEDLYKGEKTALWATNYWPNPEVKQTMIAETQNLILGASSIDDVIEAMTASYDAG